MLKSLNGTRPLRHFESGPNPASAKTNDGYDDYEDDFEDYEDDFEEFEGDIPAIPKPKMDEVSHVDTNHFLRAMESHSKQRNRFKGPSGKKTIKYQH